MMVQVPTYAPGQVQAVPLPNARLTTEASQSAFAAPARALQGVASGIQDVGTAIDKYGEARDAIDVQTAYAAAADEERGFRNDALSKSGMDALTITNDGTKFFDENTRKHAEKLSPRAQATYNKMMLSRRQDFLDTMSSYEGKQLKAVKEQTAEAMVRSAIDDAANNFNSPEAIAKATQSATGAIRSNLFGEAPEMVELKRREAISKIHAGVIDRMVVHAPGQASAYYKEHRAAINGADHGRIERLLEDVTTRGASQSAAEKIISEHADLGAQIEAARKIGDPRVQDETVLRIKARNAEAEAIRDDGYKRARTNAWQTVLSGNARSIDDLDPHLSAALGVDDKRQIMEYFASGKSVATDQATYYQLSQMAANDPGGFARVDLMQYRGKLDNGDFEKITGWQREAGKGKSSDLTQVRSTSEKVKDVLKNIDVKPESDAGVQFYRRAQDEVSAFEAQTGRKIKPEELDGVLDRLVMRVTKRGDWFDNSHRSFEVSPNEIVVPKEDRRRILERSKAKGLAVPTEDEIRSVYLRKIGKTK